jgi:hypothetical protein
MVGLACVCKAALYISFVRDPSYATYVSVQLVTEQQTLKMSYVRLTQWSVCPTI